MSASSSTIRRALLAFLILFVGAAIGAGAARIAESHVASDIADRAQSLDRLSTLSESSALMQAAVNQAMLLAGTERPATLAQAEAEASLDVFRTNLATIADDPVLTDAGQSLIDQADRILDDLGSGQPVAEIGASTSVLEASSEVFADVVSERRRGARAEIAGASETAGAITVGAIALVVFLVPAAILFAIVQWIRRRVEAEPIGAEERVDLEDPPRRVVATEFDEPELPAALTFKPAQPIRSEGSPEFPTPVVTHSSLKTRSQVARHLVTLDRVRTGTLSLVTGRLDLAPIAGRVAGQIKSFDGLIDVLAQRVEVEADPLRVDDILNLLLSASIGSGADKLALVVERTDGVGTVAVAAAGATFSPEAIDALSNPDGSEDPIVLELAVAGQLAQAMGGAVNHEQLDDMTLLTVELPLAD